MSPGVPTDKLYLTDPYTVSFEASVLSCTPRSGGGYAVVLNRTFFYPESGGQLSDRGTIAGRAVVNVWEDESGSVFHALEEPVEPGVVQGKVDAARRFDHMQQHTGQHILSRALIEAGGLHTVSFHMGDDACSIDVEGPEPSQETLDAAEALANTVVWEDRPVTVRTMPRDEVVERSLRKSIPEGVTEVRLVEVEGFDVIGCCGTHVRRAGELGLIKVLKHEKTKGAYRVYFKVGRRAFADYREKHETVRQLAMRFTTSVSNLTEKVEKLQADHQRIRKQFQGHAKRLAFQEAGELLAAARVTGERRHVVALSGDYDEDYIRLLSAELRKHPGTISLLGTTDGCIVCSAADDVDIDLAVLVAEQARSCGGSGGGKGRFANARLPETVDPAAFLEDVAARVCAA